MSKKQEKNSYTGEEYSDFWKKDRLHDYIEECNKTILHAYYNLKYLVEVYSEKKDPLILGEVEKIKQYIDQRIAWMKFLEREISALKAKEK